MHKADNPLAGTLAFRLSACRIQGTGASLLRLDIERFAHRARLAVPGTEPGGPATLGLTRREAQVLALVAAGHTNRQIARTLYMSEKTAEVHVSHILSKLGVATRGEAGAVAHRAGLVD